MDVIVNSSLLILGRGGLEEWGIYNTFAFAAAAAAAGYIKFSSHAAPTFDVRTGLNDPCQQVQIAGGTKYELLLDTSSVEGLKGNFDFRITGFFSSFCSFVFNGMNFGWNNKGYYMVEGSIQSQTQQTIEFSEEGHRTVSVTNIEKNGCYPAFHKEDGSKAPFNYSRCVPWQRYERVSVICEKDYSVSGLWVVFQSKWTSYKACVADYLRLNNRSIDTI